MFERSHRWKAVFSDIDGTLLCSDHTMSQTTRETLEACIRAGIHVTLASSRSPQGIETVRGSCGLRTAVIAFGGALAFDEQGDKVLERGLSVAQATAVVSYLEQSHLDASWNVFTPARWIVASRRDPRIAHEEEVVKVTAQEGTTAELADDACVGKVLLMCEAGQSQPLARQLSTAFPQLSVCTSSPILVEVNAMGVSKADALRALCAHWGIGTEDTLALGDGDNDLEMLRAAGLGVAMGNASAEVRRAAGSVTEDNDHDGAAHALQALMA